MPQDTVLENELDQLIEKIQSYLPSFNTERFRKAFDFAKAAHKGQMRKSGEAYITHPLQTVAILTRLRVDEATLIAALLHDVPEDTNVSLAEIEKVFGKKIAYLVDGITKLSKVHYRKNMADRQIESLKKLFIHSAEDLRVILIKLADRTHNMTTLHYITDEEKRRRIARETLEIYVPIANLLGIGELRAELEELCFQELYPEEYKKLKHDISENIEERMFVLDEMIHMVKKELKKNNLSAEIIGRPKTLYSIFQKLQMKKAIDNIDDIIAIRVIVPTRKDCYIVLSIIHSIFKPRLARLKDYIAVPKPNGYQSLHTTVFGLNGSIVEFQIRTRYMHLEAEYGIAAHYFYKYSSESELTDIINKRSSWVQRVLEIQKGQPDNERFIRNLKLDIFQDRIFTFTPSGDVIDLPQDGTAVDFAYAIHTDIGNRAVRAEINGVAHPMTTTLKSGDTIKIVTSAQAVPHLELLSFAKTNLAEDRIKQELKKLPREEKMRSGKRHLQKEFDHIGRNFLDELTTKKLAVLQTLFPFKNLEDLLIAVGEGSLSPREIIKTVYQNQELQPRQPVFRTKTTKQRAAADISISIQGKPNMDIARILGTMNALEIEVAEVRSRIRGQKKYCRLDLKVHSYDELSQIFESIDQIAGVQSTKRLFAYRKVLFLIFSSVAAFLWASHPFAINILLAMNYGPLISHALLYAGLFAIFALVFYVKFLSMRSFPEFGETRYFWPMVAIINTLALITMIVEIFVFDLQFNWILIFGLIIMIYMYLTSEYLDFKNTRLE